MRCRTWPGLLGDVVDALGKLPLTITAATITSDQHGMARAELQAVDCLSQGQQQGQQSSLPSATASALDLQAGQRAGSASVQPCSEEDIQAALLDLLRGGRAAGAKRTLPSGGTPAVEGAAIKKACSRPTGNVLML